MRCIKNEYHTDDIAVYVAGVVRDQYSREAVKMYENYYAYYSYCVLAETVYCGKILSAETFYNALQNYFKVDKRHNRKHFYKSFAYKAVRGTQKLSNIFSHNKQHSRNEKGVSKCPCQAFLYKALHSFDVF